MMGIEFGSLVVRVRNRQIKIRQYYFRPQRVMHAVALLAPPGAPLCELYI